MAECIEREKVYEMLNALGGCGAEPESWADGWDKAIDTAIDGLNEILAADVRPERHGHWKRFRCKGDRNDMFYCSECGYLMKYITKFCSDCGAKMVGKSRSENWIVTSEQLPPENQVVDAKIDDANGVRNETPLIFCNNLWWLPDKSMYIYYTPTHWRYRTQLSGKDGESDG